MVEYLAKYWLEATIVAGVIVILAPTVLGSVYGKVAGMFRRGVVQDSCLDDIDAVLRLQKRYKEVAEQLDAVVLVILKDHRSHE
jgi:hypothetical protein